MLLNALTLLLALVGVTVAVTPLLKQRYYLAFCPQDARHAALREELELGGTWTIHYQYFLLRFLLFFKKYMGGSPAVRKVKSHTWRENMFSAQNWRFTRQGFDLSLTLALLYPFLAWLLSHDITEPMFSEQHAALLPMRIFWMVLFSAAGALAGRLYRRYALRYKVKNGENTVISLQIFLVPVVLSAAITAMGADAGAAMFAAAFFWCAGIRRMAALLMAFTFVYAFTGESRYMFAISEPFSGSGAFLLIFFIPLAATAFFYLLKKGKNIARLLTVMLLLLLPLLPLWYAPARHEGFFVFALLYMIFPLVNLPFDWISVTLTRGLLRLNLASDAGKKTICLFSVLDIGLALLLTLLLAYILCFVSVLYEATLGVSDMRNAIQAIARRDPDAPSFWFYTSIFTTCIPSIFHLLFALFGLLSALFHRHLENIAQRMQGDFMIKTPSGRHGYVLCKVDS